MDYTNDIAAEDTGCGFSGSTKIAEDVIRSIAILAAADVRGVVSIDGSPVAEVKASSPGKNSFKGVKFELKDDGVRISLPVTIEYGKSLPEVSRSIQDRIAEVVEAMTGYGVAEVNVHVTGVELP